MSQGSQVRTNYALHVDALTVHPIAPQEEGTFGAKRWFWSDSDAATWLQQTLCNIIQRNLLFLTVLAQFSWWCLLPFRLALDAKQATLSSEMTACLHVLSVGVDLS